MQKQTMGHGGRDFDEPEKQRSTVSIHGVNHDEYLRQWPRNVQKHAYLNISILWLMVRAMTQR